MQNYIDKSAKNAPFPKVAKDWKKRKKCSFSKSYKNGEIWHFPNVIISWKMVQILRPVQLARM